jgi:predicted Co/Zn/Cd cation transporter (cation efflux family)
LLVSMVVSAGCGALGVAWGIAAGSQMILLDGVYAFVGIALSALLVWASALARRGPTARFPFGLEAATPLAIAVQAFVLLATLLYAAVEAAYTIRHGGSDVTAGWGIAYGVVIAAVCVCTVMWLSPRVGHSDVLIAEAVAWRVAALRGGGMIAGFAVLALIDGSRWDDAAPHVDPAMVLITCVALLPVPVRMVKGTVVELLEGSPAPATTARVDEAVSAVRAEFALDEPTLYLSKVGPKLYLELSTTASPDVTISQEHDVRESLRRALSTLPYDVWLNVELLPRDAPQEHPPEDRRATSRRRSATAIDASMDDGSNPRRERGTR